MVDVVGQDTQPQIILSFHSHVKRDRVFPRQCIDSLVVIILEGRRAKHLHVCWVIHLWRLGVGFVESDKLYSITHLLFDGGPLVKFSSFACTAFLCPYF